MKSYAVLADFKKIEYEGIHCSPTCPNLEEGLCNVFGSEEPSRTIPKVRLKSCIEGEKLGMSILFPQKMSDER